MLRQIQYILFLALWMPFYAASVESIVIPSLWDPGAREGVASGYLRYIIPAEEGVSSFQPIRNYLLYLQSPENIALQSVVPISEWKKLSSSIPVRPLPPAEKGRPRVLLLANRTSDHQANPKRLLDIIAQLEERGAEAFVLPVGAVGRLSASEKVTFYQHLGQMFGQQRAAAFPLGGQDIDPSQYGEEVNGAVGTNARMDEEEIDVIRGIYDHTEMHIIGICRGDQAIGVAFGCKMHQHIFSKEGPGTRVATEGNVLRSNRVLRTNYQVLEALLEDVDALRRSGDGRYRARLVHDHHQAVALEKGQPLRRPQDPILEPNMRLGDGSVITGFESVDRNGRVVLGFQPHIERERDGLGGKIFGAICERVLKD